MTAEPRPAGWYDDPDDPSAQRYWDGKDWTPHRQRKPHSPKTPRVSPAPQPPSNLPPPPPQLTPPSAPPAGLAPAQQAPWDQLQPHVRKARGFWSSLPRQRQLLFAAIGLLAIVVITAGALMTVFHGVTGGGKSGGGGGGGHSDSYNKGYQWVNTTNDEGVGYYAGSHGIDSACHYYANQQAQGLNPQEWIQGCKDAMDTVMPSNVPR